MKYVYAARALRDFGDGFVAVLLPVYLTSLGLGPVQVGVTTALALFGSTLTTLLIGFLGSENNQRTLLISASMLMVATGLAFATFSGYPAFLLIAFIGTINPSSGSASIFVPLEHAMLSRSVSNPDRTKVFARYGLAGALAGAAGALISGSPDLISAAGMSHLAALRVMFVLYACLGVLGAAAYSRLPNEKRPHGEPMQPKLGDSRAIVYKLAALFSIDAFAGGFAVQSMLALWLFHRFGLSLWDAGVFFFCSGVLAAFSFPVAAWLSVRFGLVNTMVFTHLPSSVFLIAAAIAPSVQLALSLLLLRAALSQMDVPTRSSFVMAVVRPSERQAAASVTSVPRSIAAAASPAIAGALFAAGLESWPLVICGALKIIYDLIILGTIRSMSPTEELR